jgi:glycolate oxidase iron-sulfur subunit
VEYGSLLEHAREAAVEARPAGDAARAILWLFARRKLLFVLMALGRVLRATGIPALGARFLPARLGRVRLGLGMLASTRRGRAARKAASSASSPEAEGQNPASSPPGPHPLAGTRVAVLNGCVQAGLLGHVNEATRRVLRANGMNVVDASGQRCCGALHAHGGDLEGARRLARINIDAMLGAGAEIIAINAAGCGAQLKDYGELLADDERYARRAARVAEKARDISEILAEAGPRRGAPLPLSVTWDAPCHLLHAQGVSEPPLQVLRAIPELELIPLPRADECCGGAGTYGITHPRLGGEIGGDKVDAVVGTGASVVATANPGCMMQIGGGLRMRGAKVEACHPVALLDESYRAAGLYDAPRHTSPGPRGGG